jgi:dihydroorotate dehydrogenase electron transfer subunit
MCWNYASRTGVVSCGWLARRTLSLPPGQYLLAGDSPDEPLPVSLVYTDSAPQGFIAAGVVPARWNPGMELNLRGPLGHGFELPPSARRVALIAFEESAARLQGLLAPALRQDSAVVLVCRSSPDDLPDAVEVQPLSVLPEIAEWSDYLAGDVERGHLRQLRELAGTRRRFPAAAESQILVHTPVPCGGVADCGVCAVTLDSGWRLACKDGPVFRWNDVM